jgi:hypothetical protein
MGREDEHIRILHHVLHLRERVLQLIQGNDASIDERRPFLLDAPLQKEPIRTARDRGLVSCSTCKRRTAAAPVARA